MPLLLRVVAGEEDDHHLEAVEPDLHVGAALDVREHRGRDACDRACVLAHHDDCYLVVFQGEFFSDLVDIDGEYDDAYVVHDC